MYSSYYESYQRTQLSDYMTWNELKLALSAMSQMKKHTWYTQHGKSYRIRKKHARMYIKCFEVYNSVVGKLRKD